MLSIRLWRVLVRNLFRRNPLLSFKKQRNPRLSFEQLEDRVVPATDTWTAAGSGNWDVGSNWSTGSVPGSSDAVIIDTTATATITIQSGDSIDVQSVNTGSTDTLSITGALEVTAGASVLSGPLTMNGDTLEANGSGVTFTANGATNLSASLAAEGGATLSLPELTSWTSNSGSQAFTAYGAGSVMNLSSLATINVTDESSFQLIAEGAGSEMNLSSLTTMNSDESEGLNLLADQGGQLNLSGLTGSLSGGEIENLGSILDEDGGTIVFGSSLTALDSMVVTLDGTDIQVAADWKSFTDGMFNDEGGGDYTLPNLTDVNGSTLGVFGDGTLTLPGVTSYTPDNYYPLSYDLWAAGFGSVLNLSNLTTINTNNAPVDLSATEGGELNLTGLTNTSFSGEFGGELIDTDDGTILLGSKLTTLNSMDVILDGTDTQVVADWKSFTDGMFNDEGGDYTLPNLTDVNGSTLIVSDGGTLTLPEVTSYKTGGFSDDISNSNTFEATGAGSVLNLKALAIITSLGTVNIDVQDGGTVELSPSLVWAGPPTFTAGSPGVANVNDPYSYQFEAAGAEPITYSATGLPAWAQLDSATGLLTGTPLSVGMYDFTVTATNSLGSVSVDVSVVVAISAASFNVDAGTNFTVPDGTYDDGTTFNVGDDATVTIDAGTFSGGAVFNLGTGAVVNITNSPMLSGTLSGTGGGTVNLYGGRMYIGTGGLTLDFPGGMFQWTGGQMDAGDGNLTNLGVMTVTAPVDFYNDGVLDNFGTIIQTGDGNIQLGTDGTFPATLQNEAGGSYLLEGTGGLSEISDSGSAPGQTSLDNLGTIEKTGGGGVSDLDVLGSITNTGTIEAENGSIALSAELGISQLSGGALTGGTWSAQAGAALQFPDGTNITTNAGTLELDGQGAAIGGIAGLAENSGSLMVTGGADFTAAGSFTNSGSLTIGSASTFTVSGGLTETAAATLTIQVGGTPASGQFGQVAVKGAAALAGGLELGLVNGYTPAAGQQYQVMTFGSATGSFTSVNLGKEFSQTLNATSLDLNTTVANPVELAVSDVAAPSGTAAGQPITVTWQTTNTSGNNASGNWQDSVYLSPTDSITASSTLLGSTTHTGGLATGGSYDGTLTAAVPALPPGSYYVFVVSDSLYQLSQPSRSGDTAAASNQLALSFPALTLGTPASGSFTAAGQDQYYQVTVPAGGSLQVVLASAASSGVTALYISADTAPTPYDNDYAADVSGQPNQTVLVPSVATETTYYILAESVSGAAATAGYTLTASQTGALGVTAISSSSGGNGGNTTIEIDGTNFASDITADLTLGSATIDATSIQFVDASQLLAVFNLAGAATGNYALNVQQGGQTATAPTTFQVLPASSPGSIQLNLSTPALLRAGGSGVAYVTVTNISNNDVGAPLLVLSSDAATLSLSSNPGVTSNSLSFLAVSPTGTPGTLTAGESVTIAIDFQSTTTDPGIKFQLSNTDAAATMDWSQVSSELSMDGDTSSSNASAALTYLENEVGPTWGDYVAMLDQNANLISAQNGLPNDLDALLNIEFNNALAAVNSSISGTLQAQDPSIQVAGVTVNAENDATQQVYSEYSLNDGTFVFPTLPAGTYTITVPGLFVTSGGSATVGDGPLTSANVALAPGGNIAGQVVNPTTGQPIADLPVELAGPDGASSSTTTDSNGDYEFSGLGLGSYTVYLPLGGPQTTETVAVTQLDGTTVTANLQLAYSATIGGTLVDASGDPIADGTVTLYYAGEPIDSAQTDASGSYQFEIVTPGTFDLLATSSEAIFPEASAVEVASGAAVTQNFQAGTGALVVAVSDGNESVSGDPVQLEALVDGSETALAVATVGSDGTADFANLAAEDYTVVATGTTGDTGQTTVAVSTGASVQATVSLTAQDAVSGTVTDSSGNPIDGAIVVLQSTSDSQQGYTASTGSDGTYSLTGVVPGTYDVTTFADGYQAVTQTAMTVSIAATFNATLTSSTTTITGNVLDLSGNAVPGGEVAVLDASQDIIAEATVQNDGSFEITSAWGSNLSLQVFATGYAVPVPISFNATVGSTVQLPSIALTPLAADANTADSANNTASISTETPLGNLIAIVNASGSGNPTLSVIFTNTKDPSLTTSTWNGKKYTLQLIQVALPGTSSLGYPNNVSFPIIDFNPPAGLISLGGKPFIPPGYGTPTVQPPNAYKFMDTPGLDPQKEFDTPVGPFVGMATWYNFEDFLVLEGSDGTFIVLSAFTWQSYPAYGLAAISQVVDPNAGIPTINLAMQNAGIKGWTALPSTTPIPQCTAPLIPPTIPGPSDCTPQDDPHDPNALIGPAGYGTQDYLLDAGNLAYTIDFENDGTAAADDVTISEQIDPNLDWSTFQLGSFGWGPIDVAVPAGLTQYQTTISYQNTDGSSLNVLVDLDFNVQTGLLTATFTSLDPTTGQTPTGVFDGFLYPNDAANDGEGYVSYTVQPAAALASGTTIDQQAAVVFDTNASISTNTVTNTIDAAAPTSSVNALASSVTSTFAVSWSGSDGNGPGIASYDVYVSTNGGAYTPWLSDTTATSAIFTGTVGDTYAFYSVATDNVGLVQSTPAEAQTTTKVVAQPALSYAKSAVTTSAKTVLSGGTPITITLQAYTSTGQKETSGGLTVTFALANKKTGGQGTFGPVTDNGNGTYTATFTGTIAGANTIVATIGGKKVTSKAASIKVTAGAFDPATSVVTVSAKTVKAGKKITVTLQPEDAAGNKVIQSGLDVVFGLGSGAGSGTFSKVTYHPSTGTYTATFTGDVSGSITITATIDGELVTSAAPDISVTPGTASKAKSFVTLSTTSVAVGGAISIMLQAEDADGNDETTGGLAVAFKVSGTGKGTIGKVINNKNGTYTATFTAKSAGSITLTATIDGVKVTTSIPAITVT